MIFCISLAISIVMIDHICVYAFSTDDYAFEWSWVYKMLTTDMWCELLSSIWEMFLICRVSIAHWTKFLSLLPHLAPYY